MPIRLLDCTLRDGGYINHWDFKERQIEMILRSLSSSGIEIVECGYLMRNPNFKKGSTLYSDISDIATHAKTKNQSYVVMINHGDYTIDKLVPQNETAIDGIRLAFHQKSIA